MRILPLGLLRQIESFDPTIHLLWNGRISRWIIAQKLSRPVPVTEDLLGCSAVTGPYSHYKFLMTCETDQPRLKSDPNRGVPITPGGWIVPYLVEHFPSRQEMIQPDAPYGDRYEREVRQGYEQSRKTLRKDLHHIQEESRRDREKFVRRDSRSFVIQNNPL